MTDGTKASCAVASLTARACPRLAPWLNSTRNVQQTQSTLYQWFGGYRCRPHHPVQLRGASSRKLRTKLSHNFGWQNGRIRPRAATGDKRATWLQWTRPRRKQAPTELWNLVGLRIGMGKRGAASQFLVGGDQFWASLGTPAESFETREGRKEFPTRYSLHRQSLWALATK